MKTLQLIKQLCALGERQGVRSLKVAQMIKEILAKNKVEFFINKFSTYIPDEQSASLVVDGKQIQAKNSGFMSGNVDRTSISSSLISSRYLIDKGGINFNPKCKSISRANFYFAPSLAISKKDISKIVNAKKIDASVTVKKQKVIVEQILVGNRVNPEIIIFSHYDSVGTGAVDNASGTAISLNMIIKNRTSLDRVLYVFDGNEELSYDYPTYWGRGYRVFEKKYKSVIERCKKIIVIDSVGNGKPVIFKDSKILNLAFPIVNKKLLKKVITIGGDIDSLMGVYHSDLDTSVLIRQEYLDLTEKLVTIMI